MGTILLTGLMGIVSVVVGLLLGKYLNRTNTIARKEKRELLELRDLVDRVSDIAFEHREIEPAVTTIIIDEVRKTRKELHK